MNRITLNIIDKATALESLANYSWNDFMVSMMTWLNTNYGLPITTDRNLASGVDFANIYPNLAPLKLFIMMSANGAVKTNSGAITYELSKKYGSLDWPPTTTDDILLHLSHVKGSKMIPSTWITYNGGYFCISIIDIFRGIRDIIGVDFKPDDLDFNNALTNEYIRKQYIQDANLNLVLNNSPHEPTSSLYYYMQYTQCNFEGLDTSLCRKEKTVLDFIKSFAGQFNIIIESDLSLRLFDDLLNAPVDDWSNSFAGLKSFKPTFSNLGQTTYIKYSSTFEGGDEYGGAKSFTCANQNLSASNDLTTVTGYYPPIYYDSQMIYLNDATAYNEFIFLYSAGVTAQTRIQALHQSSYTVTDVFHYSIVGVDGFINIDLATVHTLANSYNLFAQVMNKPKYYVAKFWLRNDDLMNFKSFRLIYCKQLGGAFFISKVSNINIGFSTEPTTVEMLFIAFKTPFNPPDLAYYIDMANNPYIDEEGNYYYD